MKTKAFFLFGIVLSLCVFMPKTGIFFLELLSQGPDYEFSNERLLLDLGNLILLFYCVIHFINKLREK
jgi:hypothetical protein